MWDYVGRDVVFWWGTPDSVGPTGEGRLKINSSLLYEEQKFERPGLGKRHKRKGEIQVHLERRSLGCGEAADEKELESRMDLAMKGKAD